MDPIDDQATRIIKDFLALQTPTDLDILKVQDILNTHDASFCSIELNLLLVESCYRYGHVFGDSLFHQHIRCNAIYKGLYVLREPRNNYLHVHERLHAWVNKIPPLPYDAINRTLKHFIKEGPTKIACTREVEEIARLVIIPKAPPSTTLLLAKTFLTHKDSLPHAVHRARFLYSQAHLTSSLQSFQQLAQEVKSLLEDTKPIKNLQILKK
jgi:hypothetical protein